MYKIGFSKENITPKVPILLAGYSPLRTANELHDNLWVRTHLFHKEDEKIIYVFSAFDLVAIDKKMHQEIKTQLKTIFPMYTFRLFLSATHTHSGPAGTLNTEEGIKGALTHVFGEYNYEYVNSCVSQCVLSIKKVLNQQENFRYNYSVSCVTNIGKNRHHAHKEGDTRVLTYEFITKSDRKSLLYFYSCHPTVLNAENKRISADLPWGVSQKLENEYEVVQFTNGNSGDISTRFTRRRSDFSQLEEFGNTLTSGILDNLNKNSHQVKIIRSFNGAIELQLKDSKTLKSNEKFLHELETLLSQKEALTATTKRLVYSKIEGIQTENRLLDRIGTGNSITIEYTLIQFDQFLFLTIPGEISSDLVRPLKRLYPDLYVMGYTNDYLFYFASEESYVENQYEAKSSFFKKGEAEKLIHYVAEHIETVLTF